MKPGVVKLKVNKEVCQGCRTCEAVCSLVHTEAVSPQFRGIQVKECFDIPCSKVCPSGCIARNAYSGAVEIGKDCVGCGACAEACPFEAIVMTELDGEIRPFKCDLCGGLPECVPACPRHALSW